MGLARRAWPILIFASISRLIYAANIPIVLIGSTQTQVTIQYTSTAPSACTITLTDNNGGTNPPRDLDPALFTSANQDLSRTSANGYRWPTLTSGLTRTVFLGGHDEVKKAVDGRYYSTALQVNSDHTISVSCNGGADTGTMHASTANLSAGSYYPELPIPVPGSPFGMAQPTVFYGGCGGGDPKCTEVNYMDPITGVLMRRITSPSDRFGADQSSGAYSFGSAAVDRNGVWTAPNNLLTNQAPATLATTSTQNAPIFAPFSTAQFGGYFDRTTDISAAVYGNASANGIHVGICLSQDSGQTCASGEQSVAISTTVGVQATLPPGYPTNYFSGWGAWNAAFAWGSYDIVNRSVSGVSVSGSTVTIITPSNPGFNLDRKAGSVFTLTSCATGGPLTLHVSSVDTISQITTTESGNTATNCMYTDLASGIRVRLIDAGTVNLSLSGQYIAGGGDGSGSNGDAYYCAKSKVTDITTDCDGVAHSTPISGYMCGFSNGIYLWQDNGRVCLQSNFFSSVGHMKNTTTPSIWLDNKTYVMGDYQNPQHVWKVAANKAGNYTEYVPAPAPASTVPDNFTYNDLGTAANVNSQVSAAGGFVAQQLATGLWGSLGFRQGIDGYTEWSTCAGKFDPYCMFAYTDPNGTLVSATAPWNSYPLRWQVLHVVPLGMSGWAVTATGGYEVGYGVDSTVPLGGPWLMRVASVQKNGSFVTHSLTVSAATNASPAQLTITNADLDVIDNNASREGTPVTCSGGTGSWAAMNITLYLHYVNNSTWNAYTDTVPTPLNSTSFGTFPGGVTCTTAPGVYTIPISAVPGDGTTNCAGAACARVTLNLTDPGFTNFFRSGASPVQDADPIVFSNLDANKNELMTQTTQYYAKVTGVPAGNIDIYSDVALTSHVGNLAIAAANGGTVSYAETCPDPSTVTLPGPLYADSGWGTTGNLKVRCVTVTVNSEPCSDYAATGEQAKYPCPADPSNAARSSLMNLAVGDGLVHASDVPFFANHEIFTVLKKNKISETNIQLTLMRWSVDNILGRGYNNCRTCDHYANIHNYGFTLTPYPLAQMGAVHFAAGVTSYTAFSPYAIHGNSHGDVSSGSTSANVMIATPYTNQNCCGSPQVDTIIDTPLASIASYVGTAVHNTDPLWNNDNSDTVHSIALAQTYPNFRQVYGQFSGTPLTQADWMAQQSGNGGNGQNNHDGSDWTRTLTKVAGTNWTYKITSPTSVNLKGIPYLVDSWPHQYFVDKSGPGSTIGDTDLGKTCHAFVANECVTGSSPGDTYFAMQGFYDAGKCFTNNQTLGTPCMIGLSAGTGWAVQIRIQPTDVNASAVRRLTLGWTLPLAHFTFHHWDATPDNKWGFFASNSVNFRENYINDSSRGSYQGAHFWAMKLPPWPAEDNTYRAGFTNIPVQLPGVTGDQIRIAFGYGENGDYSAGNLYCTTRLENCWTSASPTASNPYLFASETQSKVACGSGCTVNIPAIAGRVVFYRIERSNGAAVSLGPVQTIAVP